MTHDAQLASAGGELLRAPEVMPTAPTAGGELPYLILDIDGVLQAPHISFGHKQKRTIEQDVPTEEVHPTLIPKRIGDARPYRKPFVRFRTPVQVSPCLFEELSALPVQVVMLTSWLENCSDVPFLQQATPHKEWFPDALHLQFPGRASDGTLDWAWKWDLLQELLAGAPRPFIWVDDDEIPKYGQLTDETYSELSHLLIGPHKDIGITREDVAKMRTFLAEL